MASITAKLASNLISVQCAAPDVQGLAPEQIQALHVFKHEVLVSLHRLYMVVPPDIADPLVDKYMPKPGDDD